MGAMDMNGSVRRRNWARGWEDGEVVCGGGTGSRVVVGLERGIRCFSRGCHRSNYLGL